MMPSSLAALLELLDLEVLEENLFRGLSPETPHQRVFGGQVAAQGLVAAGRTVEANRRVHSLHSYFLRPGDPTIPIVFEVDRIRDGQSFATRRVVAIQHGKAIFNLSASFQVDEPGPDHAMPMPDVPDPETVPTVRERVEAKRGEPSSDDAMDWLDRSTPLEVRHVQEPHWLEPTRREPTQDLWFRAAGSVPDDPLLHACVVAYASDLSLIDTATLPHAIGYDTGFMIASLDHAMWFHREFRADEWMLYHQVSPSASGARGLAHGYVFRRDGALVVTVIQEGLIRPLR